METTLSGEPIESPCVRICAVSGRTGFCIGCGRTLKEIARWGAMSASERAAIVDSLPSRDFKSGRP